MGMSHAHKLHFTLDFIYFEMPTLHFLIINAVMLHYNLYARTTFTSAWKGNDGWTVLKMDEIQRNTKMLHKKRSKCIESQFGHQHCTLY